jgi:hypothetical protein
VLRAREGGVSAPAEARIRDVRSGSNCDEKPYLCDVRFEADSGSADRVFFGVGKDALPAPKPAFRAPQYELSDYEWSVFRPMLPHPDSMARDNGTISADENWISEPKSGNRTRDLFDPLWRVGAPISCIWQKAFDREQCYLHRSRCAVLRVALRRKALSHFESLSLAMRRAQAARIRFSLGRTQQRLRKAATPEPSGEICLGERRSP